MPFNGRNSWANGERLSFAAFWLDYPDDDCRVHTFTHQGKTRGGFASDCADWEDDGFDVLFFSVSLRNTSDRAIIIRLRDFVLVSRDGRSFGPVNIRDEAKLPTSFLTETHPLPPGARWRGALAFDGRVEGLIPEALSYIDGRQTLTQVFLGKHGVVFPGE